MTQPNASTLETLSIQEAADLLRLGYDSMKELIDKGRVPAVCLNQKHTVLLREDLIAFVREEGRKQMLERQGKVEAARRPAVRVGRTRRQYIPLPDDAQLPNCLTAASTH